MERMRKEKPTAFTGAQAIMKTNAINALCLLFFKLFTV